MTDPFENCPDCGARVLYFIEGEGRVTKLQITERRFPPKGKITKQIYHDDGCKFNREIHA